MCRECLLPGNLGGDIVRPQLADLRLMRLRTADVAANVCIRDERGAEVDPLRTVGLLRSRQSVAV